MRSGNWRTRASTSLSPSAAPGRAWTASASRPWTRPSWARCARSWRRPTSRSWTRRARLLLREERQALDPRPAGHRLGVAPHAGGGANLRGRRARAGSALGEGGLLRTGVRNVLFLCTGNSARSILAEAYLNATGAGRLRAYSAGSHPAGQLNPFALELLAKNRNDLAGLRSKSWEEFARPGAPALDVRHGRDRQPGRQGALHVWRPGARRPGGAFAWRHLVGLGRAALAEPGGLVRAHSGPCGGGAGDRSVQPRAAAGGDRLRRSGDLHRAQGTLGRGRRTGGATSATRPGAPGARGPMPP